MIESVGKVFLPTGRRQVPGGGRPLDSDAVLIVDGHSVFVSVRPTLWSVIRNFPYWIDLRRTYSWPVKWVASLAEVTRIDVTENCLAVFTDNRGDFVYFPDDRGDLIPISHVEWLEGKVLRGATSWSLKPPSRTS
jgi:hypothetical protein